MLSRHGDNGHLGKRSSNELVHCSYKCEWIFHPLVLWIPDKHMYSCKSLLFGTCLLQWLINIITNMPSYIQIHKFM